MVQRGYVCWRWRTRRLLLFDPALGWLQREFPQFSFRTYITMDGQPEVYFLSLDSSRRAPATIGRRAFGLPFNLTYLQMTRRGDEITFRSHRRGNDLPPAVFQARYRPAGEPYQADPGSLKEFCVEHFRYYLPAPEDRRIDILRPFAPDRDSMYVETIERELRQLQPVTATLRTNTPFEAVGLQPLSAAPVLQYSLGFEMGVEPVDGQPVKDRPDSNSSSLSVLCLVSGIAAQFGAASHIPRPFEERTQGRSPLGAI